MRFAVSAASLLALAGAALAQTANFDPISKPAKGEEVPAGSTYDIVWEPSSAYDDGTVTIALLGGSSPSTLEVLGTIAKGVDNKGGSYQWSVASDLGEDATYGLRISWDADSATFQYSFPFVIKASSDGNSTATASVSSYLTSTVSTSASKPTTTASQVNSTATESHSSTVTTASYSTSQSSNSTTSAGASKTIVTLTTTPPVTTGTPTSSPTAVSSNPAGTVSASSLALIGGLAMALFAL